MPGGVVVCRFRNGVPARLGVGDEVDYFRELVELFGADVGAVGEAEIDLRGKEREENVSPAAAW